MKTYSAPIPLVIGERAGRTRTNDAAVDAFADLCAEICRTLDRRARSALTERSLQTHEVYFGASTADISAREQLRELNRKNAKFYGRPSR